MSHPILENFQFRRLPFQADIDAAALHPCESFEQGRLRLKQAARDRGMVLITGDFGAGKTALVRSVTSQLASSSYRVLYLAAAESSNPLRSVVENLLDQLGEKIPFNNVPRCMTILQKALLRSFEQNVVPVLIIDDAQALDTRAWLGLKTLTNFQMDSKMPFCLWMLGSRQDLLVPLRQSGLTEVRSRLQFCFHLKNLQEHEMEAYLGTHLRWAGCERALFPRDVAKELFRLTHGLPRMVNRLAYHCLMAAAQDRKDLIDQSCLDHAVSEVLPPELN